MFNSKDNNLLYEAYASVYNSKEEVEVWVNSLLEEGYDLSDYTWEEMYEMYVTEGDNYDKNRQRAAKRAAERNAARDRGQTGNVPGVGYVTPRRERETYRDSGGVERHTSGAKMPKKDVKEDVYQIVLSYLLDEGYADDAHSAVAIMGNMSEEWREDILAEASVNDDRVRRNQKAFGSNYTPPRDWDQSANRGQGSVLNAKQKEKQRRKRLVRSAEEN